MQSWNSTGYISKKIGSSVTNCRFSPIIKQFSLVCVLSSSLRVYGKV